MTIVVQFSLIVAMSLIVAALHSVISGFGVVMGVFKFISTPYILRNDMYSFMEYISVDIDTLRDKVESSEVVLCYNLPDIEDDYWEAAILAKNLKWLYVNPSHLPKNHWALPYMINLSKLPVNVLFELSSEVDFRPLQLDIRVKLCEHYTLESFPYSVTIDDEAVFINGKTLLIPSKTNGEEALRQINDYLYNHDFDYQNREEEEDADLLRRLVNSERSKLTGSSQVQTIKEALILSDIQAFPALSNSMFIVKIDDKLNPVIIQIDSENLNSVDEFLESLSFVTTT